MTSMADLLLTGSSNLPAANRHEKADKGYMTAAYGLNIQLDMHTKMHIHAHAQTSAQLNSPPVYLREFTCRAEPLLGITVQPSSFTHRLSLTDSQTCTNMCLYSQNPFDSHTYFIRGHSVSLSRLQVVSLITSDTASCEFMCVYLRYVPRGLSRESEVQRPPARMLNQY